MSTGPILRLLLHWIIWPKRSRSQLSTINQPSLNGELTFSCSTHTNTLTFHHQVVCVGFIFRLIPNYFADKLGTLNTLTPFTFLCGIMMFGWIGITSVPGLFVFAAIYGSGSAGVQSLFPAVTGSLMKVPDMKKAGVRMGMTFSIISFAALTGPPLAGALIQQGNGSYLSAQM